MLFPEEHATLLKAWIVKRLENTSDADADVLADYVLALLRHDGPEEDVRKLCEAEIPDFLKEDSSVFVSDVFDAIHYKSYLPGAPPAPKRALPAPQTQMLLPQALPGPAPVSLPLPLAQSGSRKRSYHERGEIDIPNGVESQFPGGRSYKQPRRGAGRGGRGGRLDDRRNSGSGTFPNLGYQQTQFPTPPLPGMKPFDPNEAMDAIMRMQAMGIPLPTMPDYLPNSRRGRNIHAPRKRRRCRDYDEKGYCARGSSCIFQHGPDTLYIPPPPQPLQLSPVQQPTVQLPPAILPGTAQATSEEYDPNHATILPPSFQNPDSPPRPQYLNKNGKISQKSEYHSPKRRNRAPFSADGPVHDRSKSTVVVESIPEKNFSEADVREFFSQFGNVVEVSMQPYKRLAIVRFDAWAAANAAYKSPKVIFDNRFVKVFWYKEDGANLPPSAPPNGAGASDQAGSTSAGEGEIDAAEFAKKQEEAQKAYEEKTRKKEELERQKLELEKRQKELLAKQQEEKQRLYAKLTSGSSKTGGQGTVDANTAEGSEASKEAPKPTSQTEALRAQLAALEEEAKQLGLDPNAVDEPPPYWSRGRGRGRGRGGSYGFSPRGSYPSYRGRGNSRAGYAAYSLDNRPRRVAVSGVDFTVPEKDEVLRQYLFGIGEFTDIETTPSTTTITFQDRKAAEKFFYGLAGHQIPGVDGQVELTWVTGSVPTTAAPATPVPAPANGGEEQQQGQKGGGEDAAMTGVNDGGGGGNDQHQQEQVEMDYDVADENQWD